VTQTRIDPPDGGPPEEVSPDSMSPVQKFRIVAGNATRHLVGPLANFLVSYLVIRWASPELWGSFVIRLVVVTLTVHVVSWGNHEYLLRSFSRRASELGRLWRTSLSTRGLLLPLAAVGVAVWGLRGPELLWTLVWLAAAVVYQSLSVVVLFTRRFSVAVIAELAGLATTVALLASGAGALDLIGVTRAVALGVAVRMLVTLAAFAGDLVGGPVALDPRHFSDATPFFLAGLSGLLASRADLYAISALLDHAEIGVYQVTISFLAVIKSLAAVAFAPFAKDLYRSGRRTTRGVARRLFAAGFVLTVAAVPVGWVVLVGFYGLDLSWPALVVGASSILPVYGMVPLVYSFYAEDREREIMIVSFAGAALAVVLTVLMVPKMGMIGGLAAGSAAQWAIYGWVRHRSQ
jgi:O-antigen/teichoic acid export membrane protein